MRKKKSGGFIFVRKGYIASLGSLNIIGFYILMSKLNKTPLFSLIILKILIVKTSPSSTLTTQSTSTLKWMTFRVYYWWCDAFGRIFEVNNIQLEKKKTPFDTSVIILLLYETPIISTFPWVWYRNKIFTPLSKVPVSPIGVLTLRWYSWGNKKIGLASGHDYLMYSSPSVIHFYERLSKTSEDFWMYMDDMNRN